MFAGVLQPRLCNCWLCRGWAPDAGMAPVPAMWSAAAVSHDVPMVSSPRGLVLLLGGGAVVLCRLRFVGGLAG